MNKRMNEQMNERTKEREEGRKKKINKQISLSCKTMNARENFWNVYCFATNQVRDETAKDNRQTAAGISHDLI